MFLIDLILSFTMPELADPMTKYEGSLQQIQYRLEAEDPASLLPPETLKARELEFVENFKSEVREVPPAAEPLLIDIPEILVVQGDKDKNLAEQERRFAQYMSALRLTGVISVGDGRVALMNKGGEDIVVAPGSHLELGLRVRAIGARTILLEQRDAQGQLLTHQLSLEQGQQ